MPVSGRDTQEPDLANPAPGTRRKKKKESMTAGQIRAEKRLRDPGAQSGGMGVGIPQGRSMTPYRSGVYR